jgi:hypothetical protein
MGLSFEVRTVGDVTVIDWSMRGGAGCKPATPTEIECLTRIAELEALLREADDNVVWELAYPTRGREFQRRVEAALGIGLTKEE